MFLKLEVSKVFQINVVFIKEKEKKEYVNLYLFKYHLYYSKLNNQLYIHQKILNLLIIDQTKIKKLKILSYFCFKRFVRLIKQPTLKALDLCLEDLRPKITVKKSAQGFEKVAKDVSLQGIEKLKFISYNVWFEKHNFEERNQELRKIFLKFDPDFICLQEVTSDFLELLFSDKQICEKYYFSSQCLVQAYDVFILSKYPIPFNCRYFPSEMGRNLLFGVISVNNIDMAIGTTHLESIEYNDDYRQCQLGAIEDQFKSISESLLMGDFNFAKKTEDENIPEGYYDVWKQLFPNDEGHTMVASEKYPSIRFDRIILKQSQNWKPTHIELIGKDPIPSYSNKQASQYEIITPSDHYGLYLELSYTGKKN